jgi:3-hydroxybutyryl-CoA dehydrogenase
VPPAIVGIVVQGRGGGIGQVALEAAASLFTTSTRRSRAARERILDGLSRRAVKRGLHAEADDWVEARLDRIRHADRGRPGRRGRPRHQSALEDLALKRTVFRTSTSCRSRGSWPRTRARSVAEIAEATARPDRVIGIHFFNPAPVMALVEVVVPPLADPAVVAWPWRS